ncbi:unnamed protein product [Phytomonas sp. EM1]|nr:unnamed protein product [Phytomonas sp. EM1]|eukprot:CCW60396.1 unnamed protein product [Phytomonas sp. isolate EM1]
MSTTERHHHNFTLKEIRREAAPIPHTSLDCADIQSSLTDSVDEWDASLRPLPEDYSISANPRRTVPAEIDDVERELAGEEVQVTFHFSTSVMQYDGVAKKITEQDGKLTLTHNFYMGQNIEHLKVFLDEFCGLPYEKISLYIGKLLLMDPLSLSDLPFKVNESNDITVIFTE